MQSRPIVFVRLLQGVWGIFNGVRKILHFLFLIAIFSIVLIVFSTPPPTVPSRAALVIAPQGALTEQLAGTPLDRAFDEATGNAVPQTLVRDVIDALEFAADDPAIEAVYLSLDGLSSAGLTKLKAVAKAIDEFRTAGKPVIAYGTFYSQQGYFLAVHADEVLLDPNGLVLMEGYGRYRNYYAEAIDKLSITWNVFKVGSHKSYVEPYVRNDMSDEDREFSGRLLGKLWDSYTAVVEDKRGLDAGSVQRFADNFDVELAADEGDFAQTALRLGMVDALATVTEARQRMMTQVGVSDEDESTFAQVSIGQYLAARRITDINIEQPDVVAVVVASGSIIDGDAPPGEIGGDSTARLLRQARTDDNVRAVVLRIDSGGGSATASDVILEEIENIRAAGKPIIASMGGVAASGGYWIAMAADQIIAEQDTITGSIGIFGMVPTFERSLARLGVYTDGVGTTSIAGALRPDMAMSDQVKRIFQLSIEDGYRDFVGGVANYRNKSFDDVNAVAQGKVWTGSEALGHGLVDSIGDLDNAIAIAAERAALDIDSYSTRFVEPQLSAEERFLLGLMSGSARFGVDVSALFKRDRSLDLLLDTLEGATDMLARFNDPRGMYAECFCVVN
ncbi:MAG: signal peptide peptidase SppA [Pseudomonadota bacterium]